MAGSCLGLSLADTVEICRAHPAFAAAMVCDVRPELGLYTELDNCRRHPTNSITSLVVHEPEGLTDHEILP